MRKVPILACCVAALVWGCVDSELPLDGSRQPHLVPSAPTYSTLTEQEMWDLYNSGQLTSVCPPIVVEPLGKPYIDFSHPMFPTARMHFKAKSHWKQGSVLIDVHLNGFNLLNIQSHDYPEGAAGWPCSYGPEEFDRSTPLGNPIFADDYCGMSGFALAHGRIWNEILAQLTLGLISISPYGHYNFPSQTSTATLDCPPNGGGSSGGGGGGGGDEEPCYYCQSWYTWDGSQWQLYDWVCEPIDPEFCNK